MKKILCFGDSNTFGYIPNSGGKRYKENERWSGILKNLAKGFFQVTEAGCNNRTCFSYNPAGDEYNGYKIIQNYADVDTDIVLLALGINDMQKFYEPSLEDIKIGIENLIGLIKQKNEFTNIVLIIPSVITNSVLNSEFNCMFDEVSIEMSAHIPGIYKKTAEKYSLKYIDLNEFAIVSQKDGLHYEIKEHEKIAKKIYDFINQAYLL